MRYFVPMIHYGNRHGEIAYRKSVTKAVILTNIAAGVFMMHFLTHLDPRKGLF